MSEQEIIEYLSINQAFNVLTRNALDLWLKDISSGYSIVIFDLDYMKRANTEYGKEEVNRRIRESLSFRSTDIMLGQVYSGDEFAAILHPQDAYGFARRVQDNLHFLGLSATILIAEFSALESAEQELALLKDGGIRNSIIDRR
jgi:GGDEF domain-containing protein